MDSRVGDSATALALRHQHDRDEAAGKALRLIDEACASLAEVRSLQSLIVYDLDSLRRALDQVHECRLRAIREDLGYRRTMRRLGG